jgi:hypothetical protein
MSKLIVLALACVALSGCIYIETTRQGPKEATTIVAPPAPPPAS